MFPVVKNVPEDLAGKTCITGILLSRRFSETYSTLKMASAVGALGVTPRTYTTKSARSIAPPTIRAGKVSRGLQFKKEGGVDDSTSRKRQVGSSEWERPHVRVARARAPDHS